MEPIRSRIPRLTFRVQASDFGIEDAKGLLRLAQTVESTREKHVLWSAACILIAVALERALDGSLRTAAEASRAPSPDAGGSSPYDELGRQSTRAKLMQIPVLFSLGALELDRASAHLKALHKLISLRNALVHVRDEVVSVIDPQPNQPIPGVGAFLMDDEATQRILAQHPPAEPPPPGFTYAAFAVPMKLDLKDPWDSTSHEDVEVFSTAVQHYIEDCLAPGPGSLVEGGLLKKAEAN